MRWLCISGVFLLAGTCPSDYKAIKRAYCGEDGTLQAVYDDGTTKPQPKEHLRLGVITLS